MLHIDRAVALAIFVNQEGNVTCVQMVSGPPSLSGLRSTQLGGGSFGQTFHIYMGAVTRYQATLRRLNMWLDLRVK